jgi:CBS domain-containing protein
LATPQDDLDLRLAAQSDVTVLITAPSRRVRLDCARLIHDGGPCGDGPFVTAPDGAVVRQQFERARGGTLFIEDVASLTAEGQAELFLLLEDGSAGAARASLGGVARIIAGASHPLMPRIQAGAFSDALFYRLNVIHIAVPVAGVFDSVPEVRACMSSPARTCPTNSDLATVATLMWNCDCGVVPLVDPSGRLAGVITDRDICIAAATRRLAPERLLATEVMTAPVHTCAPGDSVLDALATMKREQVRRLPVVDADGRLLGVLSLNDIVLAADRTHAPASAEIVAALAAIGSRRGVQTTVA